MKTKHHRRQPQRPSRRRPIARGLAALLALTMASPLWAAPGDITQVPAPALGADPPKSRDLPDGDASVSTQTGAFQYAYPIAVPPGRLGMQPSLALSYSSQGAIYGGIASGWSLAIPEITLDTSVSVLEQLYFGGGVLDPDGWRRMRFVSSMAGGRPLVEVTEDALSDVRQTYRAKNDDSWARYERMEPTAAYRWRVRTPDGSTHYFGETARAPLANELWAPLTRTEDTFGNTIEYVWDDWQILQILYTSHPSAGLPAFARVDFAWETGFTCEGRPVGAQEDRRLDLVRGEKQLAKIRAVAFEPSTQLAQHTREISLSYGVDAAMCDLKRAPLRVLTEIQESAWGTQAPRVDLPPVTFNYNRFQRNFDLEVHQNVSAMWGEETKKNNLGWGLRAQGTWPTVEGMLLDFDGDGLQDRLFTFTDPASPDECKFIWSRNRGPISNGSILFDPASAPQLLPRLPWRFGTKDPVESCSLSGQYTTVQNIQNPPQDIACGSHLTYRWMDMTGDELPDLVTAIHHDAAFFDPSAVTGFVSWPACNPNPFSCPALESSCMDEALDCASPDEACRASESQVDACVDAALGVSCSLMTRMISMDSGPFCIEQCMAGYPGTAFPEMAASACENRCGSGDIMEPVDPARSCERLTPFEKCGGYPWMIYENRGGVLADQPQIKYQPVPLESDAGDSSFGGNGVSSTRHAIQDIDGDGNLDAVARGRYPDGTNVNGAEVRWWLVFPGDGNGNFKRFNGQPYVWSIPEAAPVSLSCTSLPGSPCSPLTFGYAQLDNFDVKGLSTLVDLNGDGISDLVWKVPGGQFDPQTPGQPWTWTNVTDGDALVLYPSNGQQFEYMGPYETPFGVPLDLDHPGLEFFSRSWTDATTNVGSFMTVGSRTAMSQIVDIDQDGRPDIIEAGRAGGTWESPSLFINQGGRFLEGHLLDGELVTGQRTLAQPTGFSTASRAHGWFIKRNLVDLDGDGLPEIWQFDEDPEDLVSNQADFFKDSDPQPLRLMSGIHNGRGATINVSYAASTDADVVTQTVGLTENGERHALPRTQWVVQSMSVSDAWDPDVSTTSYRYTNPVWKTDDEQRWDFRGFEQVTTTSPSSSTQVDRYGYDVDWSGRHTSTATFAAGQSTNPRTIAETTWDEKQLFGNMLRTYHPSVERSWTCSNGQPEAQCRFGNNGLVHREYLYQQLPETGTGQLHYAKQVTTTSSGTYTVGDRKQQVIQVLTSDADDYRLKQTFSAGVTLTSVMPYQEPLFQQETSVYDSANRARIAQTVLVDEVPSAVSTTTWDYNWATGVVISRRAPRNQPAGDVEEYVYDATKRFVQVVTNELEHVIERKYEPGTGALLSESGPSSVSCGAGCTNWEQGWTDIDGLGRPIATHVNRAVPGNPVWQKTQVSWMTYVDSVTSGARTKVVTESLIDYGATRKTREETRLDGQGRPDEIIIKTGRPIDAKTTYDYDPRGLLVAVTLPDPSQDTAATVTYTYGYDSLGRPTSMRRPSVGGNAQTGVDLSYNGLVHDRQEVGDGQAGPLAHTTLLHDNFGRMIEVREYTGATSFASTTYAYDPRDAVRRIQNPDGVLTELFQDLAGRRRSIVRAGRTWMYEYNSSGEMTSEVVPPPSPSLVAQYTTTFGYDELGRETSRAVGGREMSNQDKELFGVGTIAFGYDFCSNGVGRLCQATHPDEVVDTGFVYDAEGNVTTEARGFNLAGVSGTRTSSAVYGPGGKVVSQTYADNTDGAADATSATFAYDERGLPYAIEWNQASQLVVAALTRNVAGLVTRRSAYPDQLSYPFRELTSDWTYDVLSRVTSQTITHHHDFTSDHLARQHLDYFGQDDPSRLRHWMGASYYDLAFGYDGRHQLTSVTEDQQRFTASYSFTTAGKLATANVAGSPNPAPGEDVVAREVNYAYPPQLWSMTDPEAVTALAHVGGGNLREYSYDTAGNMVERVTPDPSDPSNDITESLVYDGEDQLRRATVTNSGDDSIEEYFYDHGGQRTAVVVRDASGVVKKVRVFFGDTELELDANGNLARSDAHLSLGTPVARVTNRQDLELQYHGLSSNTLLTVAADGTIKTGFVYAPYGELIETLGPPKALALQHRRFNDKYKDDLTKLSYYGARYYDNVLIGWTQSDPLFRFVPEAGWESPRQSLLYQFSLANPMRYTDPDGRSVILVVLAARNSKLRGLVERQAYNGTKLAAKAMLIRLQLVRKGLESNPATGPTIAAGKEIADSIAGNQTATQAARHIASDTVRRGAARGGPIAGAVGDAAADFVDDRDDNAPVDLLTASGPAGPGGPYRGTSLATRSKDKVFDEIDDVYREQERTTDRLAEAQREFARAMGDSSSSMREAGEVVRREKAELAKLEDRIKTLRLEADRAQGR